MSVRSVFVIICVRSSNISDSALPSCFSGARIDLSAEDNAIALALAECPPRSYAELIVEIRSLCCFEVLASFHHESLSPWAFRSDSHQGRAFGSIGDAVSEAPECEKENPGVL